MISYSILTSVSTLVLVRSSDLHSAIKVNLLPISWPLTNLLARKRHVYVRMLPVKVP